MDRWLRVFAKNLLQLQPKHWNCDIAPDKTRQRGPFTVTTSLFGAKWHVGPGSKFFEKTPLFFQCSGVNAANAANLQAKRR